MFVLEAIDVGEGGRRLSYRTRASGPAARLFDPRRPFTVRYDEPVGDLSPAVLAVPLVANVAPLAWFAGFDVEVPELDADFVEALPEIRRGFEELHPPLAAMAGDVRVKRREPSPRHAAPGAAALFSGGVDAYATFYRHRDERPALVSVIGADIDERDETARRRLQGALDREPVIAPFERHLVEANLRTFLRHPVDRLVDGLSWWGRVQHGMGMLGLLAPLAARHGWTDVYIGATYNEGRPARLWGSMPQIDDRIRFAGARAHHDGYALQRQQKVALIAAHGERDAQRPQLRVCYAEHDDGLNCRRCEKCLRSSFALLIEGADPSDYGLTPAGDLLPRIEALLDRPFATPGVQDEWREIAARTAHAPGPPARLATSADPGRLEAIAMRIREQPNLAFVPPGRWARIRHGIIHRFPRLFSFYLKLRRWGA